jgi:actin beta/gamma 1
MENKRNLLESEVDLKDLIVIDNGTDTIKMGYSGENYPRVLFLNRSV